MNEELNNLLRYLKKTKNKSFQKIAKLANDNVQITQLDSISISISELKNIISPKEVSGDIGSVTVKNE